MKRPLSLLLVLLSVLCATGSARGQVVIDEVGQEPAFVELVNTGSASVDLKGYRLTGDTAYSIYSRLPLAPGARLVLVLDPAAYRAAYGKAAPHHSVLLRNRIRDRGELRLYEPGGQLVDRVRYRKGRNGSWQRRSTTTAYRGPANWARAKPPTPGRAGAEQGGLALPGLDRLTLSPRQPLPGKPIEAAARLHGSAKAVHVCWRERGKTERVALKPEGSGDPVQYTGRIPPRGPETLLEVWFELTDSAGGVQRVGADWTDAPLLRFVGTPPAPTAVPRLHLELSASNAGALREPGRRRIPVTVVTWTDGVARATRGATIQARGGVWTRTWRKKGWSIRLPRQGLVQGQRRINLRAAWQDLTYLRELLGLELMREAGVPAPRARGVEVRVNGDFFGLYLQVEQVDERFLNRVGRGGAVLYQPEEPLDLKADDWTDGRTYPGLAGYEARWTKRTYRDESYADLQRFVEGYTACPDGELAKHFAQHFEVEAYVRYLAVAVLISHWDSVIKNFLWVYDRARTGRWLVVPWDLDLTWGDYFGTPGLIRNAPVLLGTRAHPVTSSRFQVWNRLRDRFLQVPEHRRRLFRAILDLCAGPFHPDRLHPRIDRWIADHVGLIDQDRTKYGFLRRDYRPMRFTRAHLTQEVALLKKYVTLRRGFLLEECARLLRAEGQAPTAAPGQKAPPDPALTLDQRRRRRALSNHVVLLLAVVGLLIYLRSGGAREEAL